MDNKKWIHFTGIAGVATGQLAVEMKKNGYIVTGSDKGLFPPMSDHLKNNGIDIQLGYKPEHLSATHYKSKYASEWNEYRNEYPDFVVYQSAKGDKNPEYLAAIEKNIKIKNYTDVLKTEVIIPESSIVVAGTFGKTTTTAMIAWILQKAGVDTSFMIGALAKDFENGVKFKNENTKYSVVEGDEYIVSHNRRTSKFFEYSPKYLLLTGIEWDHADIFATSESYLDNFKKLLEELPENGFVVYNQFDENIQEVIKHAKCKKIEYKLTPKIISKINLKLLGTYNKVNAIGAYTLCMELGIKESTILEALAEFDGIKRRMEIRHRGRKEIVIDDFGASPSKAKAAIESINNVYPKHNIHAIFEPNLGSRMKQAIDEYAITFSDPLNIHGNHDSVTVYLPRFTQAKPEYLTNTDLVKYLESKGVKANAFEDDTKLMETLISNLTRKDIIIFLGSHGFRGMIDKLIHKLQLAGK